MNAKAYYDAAAKKSEDMKLCRLCGATNVTLYIISEDGKPDRVNPVCPQCHSEHVYDQDQNLQKVVTHCENISVKANKGMRGNATRAAGISAPACSMCVHGHDLDPREGSMVVCTPQHKAHDPHYCCTGFRRITLAEIDERTAAMFGTPNGAAASRAPCSCSAVEDA